MTWESHKPKNTHLDSYKEEHITFFYSETLFFYILFFKNENVFTISDERLQDKHTVLVKKTLDILYLSNER